MSDTLNRIVSQAELLKLIDSGMPVMAEWYRHWRAMQAHNLLPPELETLAIRVFYMGATTVAQMVRCSLESDENLAATRITEILRDTEAFVTHLEAQLVASRN